MSPNVTVKLYLESQPSKSLLKYNICNEYTLMPALLCRISISIGSKCDRSISGQLLSLLFLYLLCRARLFTSISYNRYIMEIQVKYVVYASTQYMCWWCKWMGTHTFLLKRLHNPFFFFCRTILLWTRTDSTCIHDAYLYSGIHWIHTTPYPCSSGATRCKPKHSHY